MGPMRSLSSIIDEVNAQREEVRNVVRRMREASRRLTGSTGEAPTDIAVAKQPPEPAGSLPLLVSLTIALEALNSATADLRAEMNFMEGYAETSSEGNVGKIGGATLGAGNTARPAY